MVLQEKKQKDEIKICVDLRKLNDACVQDPFSTSFIDEELDNANGQEAYSFTNGFFGYHQIKITPEDRSKTTFTTEWGCFSKQLAKLQEAKQLKEQVHVVLHKEAVLKARLKPWLDEAYAVIGSIEGKLVTLQVMQQKLQVNSTREVTEQTVEYTKQVAAQCTAEVAVILVELQGLHAKISVPTE
eukprot:PITA_33646